MSIEGRLGGDRNLGGVYRVQYTMREHVVSVSAAGVVTFVSGQGWQELSPDIYTMNWRTEVVDNGQRMRVTLTGQISKLRTEVAQSLSRDLYNRQLILKVTDNNNETYVAGTQHEWLTYKDRAQTGTRPGTRNGVQWEIGATLSIAPVAYLSDNGCTDGGGGAAVQVYINGVLMATGQPGQNRVDIASDWDARDFLFSTTVS